MDVKEWTEKQYAALSQQRQELLDKQAEIQNTLIKLAGAMETLQAMYQAADHENHQHVGEEETKEDQPKSASDS